MKNVLSSIVAFTFALPVLAAPEVKLFDRATAKCTEGNCLRAIQRTAAQPPPSSRTADCSSFFKKTVIPCDVTSTNTVTATITQATDTSTDVGTDTSTTTVSTETDYETSTTTIPYSDPTAAPVLNKKQETSDQPPIQTRPDPTSTDEPFLQKMQITACTAKTIAPTSLPTYASFCSGVSKYSSACSCIGVTETTNTLVANTVYVTSTVSLFTTAQTTIEATTTIEDDVTATTTETSTATATSPIPCSGTSGGGCINGNSFYTQCDTTFTFTGGSLNSVITVASGSACLQACSNEGSCNVFDFVPSSLESGSCSLYDNVPANNFNFAAGTPGEYAGYYTGTC